jgi:S-adenosyl-L-methionine hydrolase (adenosine-forming)
MRSLITLTTDFGLRDAYVGAMKGVMADIAQEAQFIDITHEIPPHDVQHAAYVLWSALPYFPASVVHLVVVDPGVGTQRRAVAAETPWGLMVGPDNGVFSYVWASAPASCVVSLVNARYHRSEVSHTFHGRDIFAPAAAHLAAGVPLLELGPEIEDPILLPDPAFALESGRILGEVLAIDHFGNAVTSIGRLRWMGDTLIVDGVFGDVEAFAFRASEVRLISAGQVIEGIRSTYGGVAPGDALALIGSTGMLEIAVNQGHGASVLDLSVGDSVEVQFTDSVA